MGTKVIKSVKKATAVAELSKNYVTKLADISN
jgi:hypothetical protein